MAFDTSGFNLNLGQQQALVPSLAGLAPYAPNFQGLAFKPDNIQAPAVADTSVIGKGIGAALGSIGEGIKVAYKNVQDEKKQLRRDTIDLAKLEATERRDEMREARAQQNHADAMAMQNANLAVSQGNLALASRKQDEKGPIDYSSYYDDPEVNDHIRRVLPQEIQKKSSPIYFPESKLELGAPAPQVDDPGISFDSGNNLGSLSAPVVMPPQEDQRYAALREIGGNISPFSVASTEGAGPSESTPNLPYSLQGGVPRPLASVQVPNTKELYPSGGGFTPTPIPTYGETQPETQLEQKQVPRSPIQAIPITDMNGNIIKYAYLDKAAGKMLPASYVSDLPNPSSGALGSMAIPEGFRSKSMSVNAKGEKSYTYEPKTSELSEGQARLLNSFGDDYKSDPFIKSANDAVASQSIVQGSLNQQNGFGDIAAINALQRMIDPGVAVREGDVTLMQQAIPRIQRWGLKTKNLVVGDQLTADVRLEMAKLANDLVDQRAVLANEKSIPKYRKKAEKIGLDFDLVGEEFPVKSKKLQKQFSKDQKELDSLIQEIDASKNPNSPEIAAKKKRATELYLLQKKNN